MDTSEDETTTTTAGAPQSMSLEGEYTPQASNDSNELIVCKPDEVKATRDQDQESTTSTSAQSTLHDHPDKDTGMRNPTRPSEDPGDAMGDDEHRPDAPTEPPNKPLDEEVEGTRVEGSEVEMAVVEASRGIKECPDEDGSDER